MSKFHRDGLANWRILKNGGDGIRVEKPPIGSKSLQEAFPDQGVQFCWATSHGECSTSQMVDLIKEGYTTSTLDKQSPAITVSEWYSARRDCGAVYTLNVSLLNAEQEVLRDFSFSDDIKERYVWQKVAHTFICSPHTRYVLFTHSGKDTQNWAGHYGAKFTLSNVRINSA